MRSTFTGRCGVIPATWATVTRLAPGANTNPTASAPSSAASLASSRFVFAQILIHIDRALVPNKFVLKKLDAWGVLVIEQQRQRRTRIRLTHQSLAHQKSVVPNRTQLRDIVRRANPALSNRHRSLRHQ